MSTRRTAAVVLLGILLTITLSVGNVVFAAHATVLDPGFTTNAIEEEDGYETLGDMFTEPLTSGSGGDGESEGNQQPSLEGLVDENAYEDVVTEEYMRSEFEPNIYRVYAYLHGSEDTLNLSLDAEPIAENVGEVTADAVENSTTSELFTAVGGGDFGDVPVDESTVEKLDGGQDSYESAQADVRSSVYDRVLTAAVDQAFEERSNDELLSLVIEDYDPDDYSESEKERMVSEREDEIRAALATAIESERGDELESRTDEELSAMASSATSEDVSTGESALDEPATDYRDVTILALTGQLEYDTYQEREASARSDLAAGAGDVAEAAFLDGAGERIDLNEEMEIPEEGAMEQQASIVGWLDRLAIVIPVLALGFVGGVWYLTRSVGRTVGTVGWSLAWAGIPAFLGAWYLSGNLGSIIDVGQDPDPFQVLTLGILERTVGHLAAQSLVVGLLGVGLVGVAFAFRTGLHERFLGESEPTASGEAVETEGESDPLADRNEDQTDSTDSGAPQHEDR